MCFRTTAQMFIVGVECKSLLITLMCYMIRVDTSSRTQFPSSRYCYLLHLLPLLRHCSHQYVLLPKDCVKLN